MRVGLGRRFLIEAGFLVAVAVVAGLERLRTLLIVALMAAAWLLVAVVEFLVARVRGGGRVAEAGRSTSNDHPWAEPQPEEIAAQQEPEPETSPGPSPAPQPRTTPEGPSAPEEPERAPEHPEPEPEPPPIAAVAPPPEPEPGPEPEPEREPMAEPAAQIVSLPTRASGPREWNIWDLERLTRDPTGDTARDEERAYLLMYLREFAAADGMLPADFDGVVRESFSDVLDAAYS